MGCGWDDFSRVFPVWSGTHRMRKAGQYLLNEFVARGRHGSVHRWGRLWGWLGSLIRWRFGWQGGVTVIEVLVDGIADGPAPGVGAEGVDVLVLGKMDGLGESLGEIGEGAGGAGLN
jgi:hypothetical protein